MDYCQYSSPSEVFLHSPYGGPNATARPKPRTTTSATAVPFHSKAATLPSSIPAHLLAGSRPPSNQAPVKKQTETTVKGFSRRNDRLLYDGVPVCLDYLKGTCSLKRLKCRFAHPPLHVAADGAQAKQGEDPRRMCEVFLLTGFCKFGAQCRDFHPPLHAFSPICAPARTTRMTTECKEAAAARTELRERFGAGSGKKQPKPSKKDKEATSPLEEEPSPAASKKKKKSEAAADAAAQKAAARAAQQQQHLDNAVIGDLTRLVKGLSEETFHSTLQRLADTFGSHKAAACLAVLLPAAYSQAVQSPERARLYAKFCQYLTNVLPPADRQPLRGKLAELCGKLLFHVGEVAALLGDGPEALLLQNKRVHNAHFIGALHHFGVFGSNYTSRVVEFLLSKALLTGVVGADSDSDSDKASSTCSDDASSTASDDSDRRPEVDPDTELHIRLLCAVLHAGRGAIAAEPTPQVEAALRHLRSLRKGPALKGLPHLLTEVKLALQGADDPSSQAD